MTLSHAVVRIDHQAAEVIRFDAEQVQVQKLHAASHETRQHGSGVRDEHEFFASVCDALAGISQVLVTGSKMPLIDFRHCVEKHRPRVAAQIVGWDLVDHPSEAQLVAHARQHFIERDGLAGSRTIG